MDATKRGRVVDPAGDRRLKVNRQRMPGLPSDLVARLNARASGSLHGELFAEAAAEIEKLRRRLAQFKHRQSFGL